jgi:hypothetical protein
MGRMMNGRAEMIAVSMPEGVLHAERADVHSKAPAVYSAGRVCAEPGCRTVLSIYNKSSCCAVHGRATEMAYGHRVHRGRRNKSRRVAA